MGAAGVGKSTFLDLLPVACKIKRGILSRPGVTLALVNGREDTDVEFKNVIDFVDQDSEVPCSLKAIPSHPAVLPFPVPVQVVVVLLRCLVGNNQMKRERKKNLCTTQCSLVECLVRHGVLHWQ
jgi:hypothetical protein